MFFLFVFLRYFFLAVGPRVRPQRAAGSVADGVQLRSDVRRNPLRVPVGQVRSQENVRDVARRSGSRRKRHRIVAQLLRLHCSALHRRGTRTGALYAKTDSILSLSSVFSLLQPNATVS